MSWFRTRVWCVMCAHKYDRGKLFGITPHKGVVYEDEMKEDEKNEG